MPVSFNHELVSQERGEDQIILQHALFRLGVLSRPGTLHTIKIACGHFAYVE